MPGDCSWEPASWRCVSISRDLDVVCTSRSSAVSTVEGAAEEVDRTHFRPSVDQSMVGVGT